MRLLALSLAMSASGCFPHGVPVRIDAPAGATFRLEAGTFHDERTLPAPFQATFGVGGTNAYSFVVHIPADVARRYGGQADVDLYATLWTLHRVDVEGRRALRVPLEDDAVRAVISGQQARVTVTVRDPGGSEEPALRFTLSRTRMSGEPVDRPTRRAPRRDDDEDSQGRQISRSGVSPVGG